MTATELKKRAIALAEKTKIDSVTPEEVGQLSNDIVEYIENVEINGSSLGIRKTYTSVSAMEADSTAPKDDKGVLLRRGMLVNIYNQEDPDSADNGKVFSFQNPGWAFRGTVDAGYATKEELTELDNKVRIVRGIVTNGQEALSELQVDINSDIAGSSGNNRAFPNVYEASGLNINAYRTGKVNICVLNKIDRSKTQLETIDIQSTGIQKIYFSETYVIDEDCVFYVEDVSGNYCLALFSSNSIYYPCVGADGSLLLDTLKGEVLVQLISIKSIKNDIHSINKELSQVKTETEKIPVIESDVKELQYISLSGIIESGKCGGFDVSNKIIKEGKTYGYKSVSLQEYKTLTVNNTCDFVFYKGNKFVFYVKARNDKTNIINLEPLIKTLAADRVIIIAATYNGDINDDEISLSGLIISESVDNELSGNLYKKENIICNGSSLSTIMGIQSLNSAGQLALLYVEKNSTIYHKQYHAWKLYNSSGDYTTQGSGYSDTNIDTGESEYMLIDIPVNTPLILSYNKDIISSSIDVPYYTLRQIVQDLEDNPYETISSRTLISVLKNYIADKYADKSVFFVGDSYAYGQNISAQSEYNVYPQNFSYRHPLANVQAGAGYVWSGRTISSYTSDNICKSVLSICNDYGYFKSTLNHEFTETSGLSYTKSILFEDISEIDRVIANQKTSFARIYSVNKENFAKTQLVRFKMNEGVQEYTFRNKIKALDGECIGIEYETVSLAYKADEFTFKAIDGSVINGSAMIQVCCNRCDYLIMEGGLNDMYQRGEDFETQVPFGTLLEPDDYTTNTFDDRTFCGALEHMVREAVFKLPATKLGFLIMPQPGDEVWNNQYAKAIRDVCDKYGVPYLDMGNLKRMKVLSTESEASRIFWSHNPNGSFNYHPSDVGYRVLMNDAINTFIDSL